MKTPILNVYHCNPTFVANKDRGRHPYGLLFGFENEIAFTPRREYSQYADQNNTDGRFARYMIDHPYLYAKVELSNNGIEINSHPFNFNWFLHHRNFVDELQYLRNSYFRVNNSCGFHIHLSRDYFTKKHLTKMVKFFYDGGNAHFLFSISRRTKNAFVEWAFCGGMGSLTEQECKELVKECWGGKNCGLNLYQNDTIEIRIFKATTNPKLFRAYMEFALAVTLFTQQTDFKNVTIKNFRKFVDHNIMDFIHLRQLISNPNKFNKLDP